MDGQATAKYDTRDGEVVLSIGPIELEMSPEDAEELALKLMSWAERARGND